MVIMLSILSSIGYISMKFEMLLIFLYVNIAKENQLW